MRNGLRIFGTLLFAFGLAGLLALAFLRVGLLPQSASVDSGLPRPVGERGEPGLSFPEAGAEDVAFDEGPLPITAVRIPRIQLEASVVPSRLVEKEGGATWEVPAFKVGHAELTASAGRRGNAVLFGHVDSLNLGNVFKDLQRVRTGDDVEIWTSARLFTYRVTDVRSVTRTDVSVLAGTETPTVSLITCTGRWLPHLSDFSDRLVVRAELVDD